MKQILYYWAIPTTTKLAFAIGKLSSLINQANLEALALIAALL